MAEDDYDPYSNDWEEDYGDAYSSVCPPSQLVPVGGDDSNRTKEEKGKKYNDGAKVEDCKEYNPYIANTMTDIFLSHFLTPMIGPRSEGKPVSKKSGKKQRTARPRKREGSLEQSDRVSALGFYEELDQGVLNPSTTGMDSEDSKRAGKVDLNDLIGAALCGGLHSHNMSLENAMATIHDVYLSSECLMSYTSLLSDDFFSSESEQELGERGRKPSSVQAGSITNSERSSPTFGTNSPVAASRSNANAAFETQSGEDVDNYASEVDMSVLDDAGAEQCSDSYMTMSEVSKLGVVPEGFRIGERASANAVANDKTADGEHIPEKGSEKEREARRTRQYRKGEDRYQRVEEKMFNGRSGGSDIHSKEKGVGKGRGVPGPLTGASTVPFSPASMMSTSSFVAKRMPFPRSDLKKPLVAVIISIRKTDFRNRN